MQKMCSCKGIIFKTIFYFDTIRGNLGLEIMQPSPDMFLLRNLLGYAIQYNY